MDAKALRVKLGMPLSKLETMDEDGLLAAPVDIAAMFQHGVVEADEPNAETKKGLVITGDVALEEWTIGAPVWVRGNVTAGTIRLTSDLVVEGELRVKHTVHGSGEPNLLTVLGPVTIGRAICEHQFIMQFLGGGSIDELIDDEGGGKALLELLRKAGSEVAVKRISNALPRTAG